MRSRSQPEVDGGKCSSQSTSDLYENDEETKKRRLEAGSFVPSFSSSLRGGVGGRVEAVRKEMSPLLPHGRQRGLRSGPRSLQVLLGRAARVQTPPGRCGPGGKLASVRPSLPVTDPSLRAWPSPIVSRSRLLWAVATTSGDAGAPTSTGATGCLLKGSTRSLHHSHCAQVISPHLQTDNVILGDDAKGRHDDIEGQIDH